MNKDIKDLNLELQNKLEATTKDLSKVTSKKMFGCHALWANDNVFALVWKHGRIGVKLPIETEYETLLNVSGAEPWKTGPMKMAHWVLVPESFHNKTTELKKWTTTAHALCSKLEKKSSTKKSKSVSKKQITSKKEK